MAFFVTKTLSVARETVIQEGSADNDKRRQYEMR
jgi:hypothetical protein